MPDTLIDMLRSAAERVGDEHGIRFYETRDHSEFIGFATLDERSRMIAAALEQRGFVPGDVVVLALNSDLECVQAVYGVLYAGLGFASTAVTGTSAPEVMAGRIAGIAQASDARLIISQDSTLEKFRQLTSAGLFGGVPVTTVAELLQSGDAAEWVQPEIDSTALAGLGFTSGSTGDPKGVIYTHGTLLEAMGASDVLMGGSQDSVIVGWSPFHHVMGLTVQVMLPAYLGASAAITSVEQFQRRPIFWLQLISKHRATFSAAANFAFALCTQMATDEQIAELDLSSLEMITIGAEPVRMETLHAFVDRFASTGIRETVITPAFGATEATLVTMKPRGREMVVLDIDPAALEAGTVRQALPGERSVEMVSCGTAGPTSSLKIVDPATGKSVLDGQVGEIWISGPGISPGYWHRPDATAEVFGARLEDDDRSYYRTGDLGAQIDGELFVTGRLKDLIIVRGRNIYPQDIEAAAMRLRPEVGTGTAFELSGHPSEIGIVLELRDEAPTEDSDRAALAHDLRIALLHEFSLPSLAIAFLLPGDLPRTGSGKVRRASTRSLLESAELPVVYADGFASGVKEAAPSLIAQ
jgi:acyl-CoA synthetase (AMP-forming)/AMP-acid ligase II